MRIEVRCFAAAREAVGARVVGLDVPPETTVGDVRRLLFERYPTLASLRLQFAVNMSYVREDATAPGATVSELTFATLLHPGDEVACIPPVGGG